METRIEAGSPALDLADVSFVRGGRELLSGVNWRVEPGERWALLGPNGAGKSTLLSMASATSFPSRGRATVLGHQMGRVDLRALRRLIGLVDPRHRVLHDLDALGVALTGATGTTDLVPHWTPSEAELDRAHLLLKTFGLEPRATRWSTMSQGERGRALIARALMAEPDLLLLDEPSTGLDLVARELMLRTVDELPALSPGITTVVVTHHFEELPSGTTHALLLRDGRLTAAGPVDQTLTSEHVSECFTHPIRVTRDADGRWRATA